MPRLSRGEDLDASSRELGIEPSRIAEWRDRFLGADQSALESREPDARDEEILRLEAKFGDLTMDEELSREKIDRLEEGPVPPSRRPKP